MRRWEDDVDGLLCWNINFHAHLRASLKVDPVLMVSDRVAGVQVLEI